MPSDFNSPTTRSTAKDRILLIEEYDALVAAITSALKKFAPNHAVEVVPSLAEAKHILSEVCPPLIILDFDPAGPGATEFFQQCAKSCPDTRVMVMGAGVSAEMASDFRRFGAIHFMAKPFEVAEFGATVQALLGPGTDLAPSARTIRSLGAADLTLIQCAGSRSVVLHVNGDDSKRGEIHIVEGKITHAKMGRHKDGDALEEIFEWSNPGVEELEDHKGIRTIREAWDELFLEAVRNTTPHYHPDTVARVPQKAVPLPEKPKPAPKTGKKIVAVDDTEMLLVFVEDTLMLADPQLQISTAPNGITGIKEIETIQPDLVLLDYSLPDINGDEVCRRLLQNERTARIPVLMMSGHVPEMTRAAAQLDNIVATIAKPFMSEAFAALVQQTLSKGLRPTAKIRPLPSAPPTVAKAPPAKQVSPPPPPPPKPAAPKAPPPKPPPAPSKEAPKPEPVPPMVIAQPVPAPMIQPAPQLQPEHSALRSNMAAPVVAGAGGEVVLGLFLEVLSMQLTPSLRMGTIRAKPSSPAVSLHVSPASAIPVETGFKLGRVQLDLNGRIATLRLIPTSQPPQRLALRNAFELSALDLVPNNSREQVRLTPSAHAPMTMQLLAHFEMAGVELSNTFQLAELILKVRSNTVRVTLSSEAVGQQQTGVFCETTAVQLDNHSSLAELLLKPLK